MEPKTEGPTVFPVNKDFQLHKKSSCAVLMNSLKNAGVKEMYLDRVWAPDYKGCIFHMKTFLDTDLMQKFTDKEGKEQSRPTAYKVVDKIMTGPGEAKKIAKEKGSKGEKAEGGNATAEAKLSPILQKISEEKDGTTLTKKGLNVLVSQRLQSAKPPVDQKLHVPILSLVKDDKWLRKNAGKYDMTLEESEEGQVTGITFGTVEETEGEE